VTGDLSPGARAGGALDALAKVLALGERVVQHLEGPVALRRPVAPGSVQHVEPAETLLDLRSVGRQDRHVKGGGGNPSAQPGADPEAVHPGRQRGEHGPAVRNGPLRAVPGRPRSLQLRGAEHQRRDHQQVVVGMLGQRPCEAGLRGRQSAVDSGGVGLRHGSEPEALGADGGEHRDPLVVPLEVAQQLAPDGLAGLAIALQRGGGPDGEIEGRHDDAPGRDVRDHVRGRRGGTRAGAERDRADHQDPGEIECHRDFLARTPLHRKPDEGRGAIEPAHRPRSPAA
jgi:hypothetical protein